MKLQQERLLVQQLETEAAHMHLAGEAGPIACSIRPFCVHTYCSALAQDRLRQPLGLEHMLWLQDNVCMGIPEAIQLGYRSAAPIYILPSLVIEAAGACIRSPVTSPASLLLDTASSHKQPEFRQGLTITIMQNPKPCATMLLTATERMASPLRLRQLINTPLCWKGARATSCAYLPGQGALQTRKCAEGSQIPHIVIGTPSQ